MSIWGFPLGASEKWIWLSTILNDPLWIDTDAEFACVFAKDPTTPLSSWTSFTLPLLVIGPTLVVPNPTLITLTYSSSINNKSVGLIEEISLKTANVALDAKFSDKLCVIPENLTGYWTSSSTSIIHFVFFSFIVNLWAFPSPRDAKVTPVPLWAADVVIATLKVFSDTFMAYTVDGKTSVAFIIIALVPTPTIVESGV